MKVTSWFFVLALIATQTLMGIAQETPLVFTNPEAVPVPPTDEQTAHDRSYAMELYAEGKCEEAFPWLKKVIQAAPDDAVAREKLGSYLLGEAANTTDPVQRKRMHARARTELLKAHDLGDSSDFLRVLLAGIPEDGSAPKSPPNAEVHQLIKQGDAAFGQHNYDAATDAYLKALALDPSNYEAMVFVGDVYFAKRDYSSAGEWFAQAIVVDPNREIAYRYWGDTLSVQGKFAAAREKYICAVISEPYNDLSWKGVSNFTSRIKQQPTLYHFQSPDSFQKTGTGYTVALSPHAMGKKDGSSAWIAYPLVRVTWQNGKFAEEFPGEKQYRHSLKEENEALGSVAKTAEEFSRGKRAEKLNDELSALVMLYKAGLLESYILLNGADDGIAKDYPTYRATHRDVLVRYLSEIVLPPAPADGTTP